MQAVDQGALEAAIKEAESVSAQSKTARQQADELSRKSNAAWEKVRNNRKGKDDSGFCQFSTAHINQS